MAKAKPTTTPKSDQQQQPNAKAVANTWDMHDCERLAKDLANVLANPACPEKLYNFIGNGLSEVENEADRLSPTFLSGLFRAPKREAGDEGAGR